MAVCTTCKRITSPSAHPRLVEARHRDGEWKHHHDRHQPSSLPPAHGLDRKRRERRLNNGKITVGPAGLQSSFTSIQLHAADDITVTGRYSHRGNIEFIARKGSDVPTSNGIHTSAVSRPADETADNFGAVTFNARVDTRVNPLLPVGTTPVTAADGEIMVVTAAVNSSPLLKQNNVTQGAGRRCVQAADRVTLKRTGGLGVAGADILLDNPSSSVDADQHQLGGEAVRLRLGRLPDDDLGHAGEVSGSTTQYAGGTIRYTDTLGVNLTGLGTVSDFSSFTSGTLTLSASTSRPATSLWGRASTSSSTSQRPARDHSIASNTLTLNAGRDILYVNSTTPAPATPSGSRQPVQEQPEPHRRAARRSQQFALPRPRV